jgi:hypothetical protein
VEPVSVRITSANPDGSWTFFHDEEQHQADADPSTVQYGEMLDGSPNPDTVLVTCPVCGAVSYWPSEALPAHVEVLS